MEEQRKQGRRKFTPEFKKEAVRLLDTRKKSAKDLEEELGLAVGQIYRWRKELQINGKHAFPGNGNPRDEEIARLRKEVEDLREQRDILRKAMAIFSRIQK